MKKAFLVTAVVKTRVVVDVDENYDGGLYNGSLWFCPNDDEQKIITDAIPRLKDNVCEDNIESVELDIECPYDEEFDN